MPKKRRNQTPRRPRPATVTVSIREHLNFPPKGIRDGFLRELAKQVREFPVGRQEPWGIPFEMAGKGSRARVILVRSGQELTVPVGAKADYICLLHTFRKSPRDKTEYVESQPVGEYGIVYSRGSSHVHLVRARLDVPIPESPGPAQMAVPFHMPLTADPVAPPQGRRWGQLQYGLSTGREEPLVFALRNPQPTRKVQALVIRGLTDSALIIAGVTCFRGTAHPLRHLPRRMYRIKTTGGRQRKVESVEVSMGAVARRDQTIGPRGKAWLKAAYAGVDGAADPSKDGEDIYSIYGAADATVSAEIEGRKQAVNFSLAEAYETSRSLRDGVSLERLGGSKQWVQVDVIDASTGKPTPVRLHISGPRGEYIAPYGHHEQVNANWFEDYGADLRVSGRNYAYVPGQFTTDLPTGDLYVEMTKGFEYVPTRCKVTLRPGQRKLRLSIRRWKDLRSAGWVTADTHVHFLSPQTAWLEAQAEGVNVVNLLASQWGRLFTNVGDISGRLGIVEDDTIVWTGTENRNHMLGHISMLGTKGLPVFPMCCGGISESWVGDPDYRTLTEWARECKARDGVVIRPHFPYCGFTEDPVLAVKGVVDALEIRTRPGGGFPIQEWYRYLNNGYRVAVAGGTDKMGANCALGSLRTYARIEPGRPFTYENWAKAVRAGRTISTNGPLLDIRVEDREIGDTIRMLAGGGTVEAAAAAESAWNVGDIEIVCNGNVVARQAARSGERKLTVSAKVAVAGSGWIAARCTGVGGTPSGYMAAHTSPVYIQCGNETPFDGPALEHMLNLTRGGIEYLETISTRFDDKEQERMIRIYREVERHLRKRLRLGQ